MKLQPASQKELRRIAVGTAVCTGVLLIVFGVLGALKVVRFTYAVPLGAVCGALVAVGNFAALCFTVQAAAAQQDPKQAKARVQTSYNMRLLVQGLWCLAAYMAPCFQTVAAVLPLLFPRLVIFILQITGRYQPDASAKAPEHEER